jgi:Fe2+ or Zn2+ uptake regulation protein
MDPEMMALLESRGIQPSAQRVAVAEYALRNTDHPSADAVWAKVRAGFPLLSRATVYNTLNLFVERGLLRALALAEGKVVFDPNVAPHHHFIDETTGAIHDVPWDAVSISRLEPPSQFQVREYQVIMRGNHRPRSRTAKPPRTTR